MMSDNEENTQSFNFVDKRRVSLEGERAEEPEETLAKEPSKKPVEQEQAQGDEEAKAPPVDFSTLIISLSTSAAHHMGGFQDPVSGKTSINLELAKQTVDIISMLEEKTKGNLSEDEEKLLSHVLYDLRMQFVQLSQGGGGGQ